MIRIGSSIAGLRLLSGLRQPHRSIFIIRPPVLTRREVVRRRLLRAGWSSALVGMLLMPATDVVGSYMAAGGALAALSSRWLSRVLVSDAENAKALNRQIHQQHPLWSRRHPSVEEEEEAAADGGADAGQSAVDSRTSLVALALDSITESTHFPSAEAARVGRQVRASEVNVNGQRTSTVDFEVFIRGVDQRETRCAATVTGQTMDGAWIMTHCSVRTPSSPKPLVVFDSTSMSRGRRPSQVIDATFVRKK